MKFVKITHQYAKYVPAQVVARDEDEAEDEERKSAIFGAMIFMVCVFVAALSRPIRNLISL